eukprot:TRINITY_DN7259_c0_g2_i1.p1 TRINITY_DN7259_c0_g2~~TRINITY_DN7259_c0_g2_i1.p1  ORF type:complete len:686 (+),score=98.02 TRINITY_DN7259_c0_g2_i1:50-2107(+)
MEEDSSPDGDEWVIEPFSPPRSSESSTMSLGEGDGLMNPFVSTNASRKEGNGSFMSAFVDRLARTKIGYTAPDNENESSSGRAISITMKEAGHLQHSHYGDGPVLQGPCVRLKLLPHHRILADIISRDNGQQNSLHETGESQADIERDEYGFQLTQQEAELRRKASEANISKDEQSYQEWNKYLHDIGSQSNRIVRSSQLRKLVGNGIPSELRGQIWQVLSHVDSQKSRFPVTYQNIKETFEDEVLFHESIIDNDLLRTFPGHGFINSPTILQRLRRILRSYAAVTPEVGYCQSMNFIAGTLLLFMSEEEAFWMLFHIVDKMLPTNFYSRDIVGAQIENRVLNEMLRQKLAKPYDHLDDLGVPLPCITLEWIMCLLVNTLPFETTMKVWDLFFYEGLGIIFSVCFGIIKVLEKQIMECQNTIEAITILKEGPRKIFDWTLLRQMSESTLSLSYINSPELTALRKRFDNEIQSEMSGMEEKRQDYHRRKSVMMSPEQQHLLQAMRAHELKESGQIIESVEVDVQVPIQTRRKQPSLSNPIHQLLNTLPGTPTRIRSPSGDFLGFPAQTVHPPLSGLLSSLVGIKELPESHEETVYPHLESQRNETAGLLVGGGNQSIEERNVNVEEDHLSASYHTHQDHTRSDMQTSWRGSEIPETKTSKLVDMKEIVQTTGETEKSSQETFSQLY